MKKSEAGKGDRYRPVNKKVYDRNYDKVYNKSFIRRILFKLGRLFKNRAYTKGD